MSKGEINGFEVSRCKYNQWLIVWNERFKEWDLYTPMEAKQPVNFRVPSESFRNIEDAKPYIDKRDNYGYIKSGY